MTPDIQDGEYPYSIAINDHYTLYWKVENNLYLNFAIVAKTNGWVGIGLNPADQGMEDCDMIIGRVENGKVTVGDYWSEDQNMQMLDHVHDPKSTQDIQAFSGKEEDVIINVKVRLILSAGSNYD